MLKQILYVKKEITVINKTVNNFGPSQTIALNNYVMKKPSTTNKLKIHKKIRPPLTNYHTPYQSICNKAVARKNTNKQKEHSTI